MCIYRKYRIITLLVLTLQSVIDLKHARSWETNQYNRLGISPPFYGISFAPQTQGCLLQFFSSSSLHNIFKKNHATKHALKHYARHKGNIVVFWYTRAYVDRRRIRALLNRFFAFIFRTQIVGKCQSPPCPRPARTCMRASISDRESEGRKWRRFTEPWTTK